MYAFLGVDFLVGGRSRVGLEDAARLLVALKLLVSGGDPLAELVIMRLGELELIAARGKVHARYVTCYVNLNLNLNLSCY